MALRCVTTAFEWEIAPASRVFNRDLKGGPENERDKRYKE